MRPQFVRGLESRVAREDRPGDRQVPGRPEAVGGHGGAHHRAGRKGLARRPKRWISSRITSACRRSRSTRSRAFYTMYDLKPVGTPQDHDLHQSAVRAAGRQRRGGASQEEARHRLQRDHRGRRVHAEGRRMLRRLRRRARAPAQQQAHVLRDDAGQARRAAGGAEVMGLPAAAVSDRHLRPRRDHHEGAQRPQLAPQGLRGARRL